MRARTANEELGHPSSYGRLYLEHKLGICPKGSRANIMVSKLFEHDKLLWLKWEVA